MVGGGTEEDARRRQAREEALSVLRTHGPDLVADKAVLCRAFAAACMLAVFTAMSLTWLGYRSRDGSVSEHFTGWSVREWKFHEAPGNLLLVAVPVLFLLTVIAVFQFSSTACLAAGVVACVTEALTLWCWLVRVPDGYLGHDNHYTYAGLPTFVVLVAVLAVTLFAGAVLARRTGPGAA